MTDPSYKVKTVLMDDLENAMEREKPKQRPDEPKKPKKEKDKRKRSIIQMISTGLKPNKKNWAIVEI